MPKITAFGGKRACRKLGAHKTGYNILSMIKASGSRGYGGNVSWCNN